MVLKWRKNKNNENSQTENVICDENWVLPIYGCGRFKYLETVLTSIRGRENKSKNYEY